MNLPNMSIHIQQRPIGTGYPTYIVAEMSANHNQDFDKAIKIIHAAKEAGADAIKLQTYTPQTLTIDCRNEYFQAKGTLWSGRTLHDLYSEAATPWEWQPKLKKAADSVGLDFFSTPFDFSAVDFLEKLKVAAYKVASFENNDLALLRKIAQTGKPVLMSTGLSTKSEIEEAVGELRTDGCEQLVLLKCTSAYPAPAEEINLRTLADMSKHFAVPVGLSDHTLGIAVPTAAVALGACVIEKHFTLSRSDPGTDSAFSLEPSEFKAMVREVRVVEKALGDVCYEATPSETSSRVFKRSLFVVKDIQMGELFTEKNIRSIRPGYGLHPRYLNQILGRQAAKNLKFGTPLSWNCIGNRK